MFVHLKNANRKVRSRVLLVFAITLVVYLSLPTRIYYGDGIGFADDIESAHTDPSLLFHANHLIYESVGYAAMDSSSGCLSERTGVERSPGNG